MLYSGDFQLGLRDASEQLQKKYNLSDEEVESLILTGMSIPTIETHWDGTEVHWYTPNDPNDSRLLHALGSISPKIRDQSQGLSKVKWYNQEHGLVQSVDDNGHTVEQSTGDHYLSDVGVTKPSMLRNPYFSGKATFATLARLYHRYKDVNVKASPTFTLKHRDKDGNVQSEVYNNPYADQLVPVLDLVAQAYNGYTEGKTQIMPTNIPELRNSDLQRANPTKPMYEGQWFSPSFYPDFLAKGRSSLYYRDYKQTRIKIFSYEFV